MAFKDTRLGKAWNAVTNVFKSNKQATPTTTTDSTQQEETKPTNITTTTNPTNIKQPTGLNENGTVLGNPTNTNTLNETIEKQKSQNKFTGADEITNSTINQTSYYDISGVDKEKINNALTEREKQAKEKWRETGLRWGKELAKGIGDFVNGQTADSETQANEVHTYVGYNKDNNDVYEMVLNTDGVYSAQDKYNNAINNFYNNVNSYGPEITQEQYNKEFDDLYNQVSGLFKAKADDWYSDGFIFQGSGSIGIGRRKDLFSEEELNALEQNGVEKMKEFIPSKTQLQQYLLDQEENQQIRQKIANKYDVKDDPLDLDNSITGGAQEKFMNGAMTGVIDLAKQNLNPDVAQRFLLNSEVIVNDTFQRAWDAVSSLKEDAELTKLLAQREGRELTEDEKKGIQYAENVDAMMDELRNSINTIIKEHCDNNFVDESGHIIGMKDVFSDGRDLWGVLSHPVISASGLDADSWTSLGMSNNMSWLDAFQKVGNQGRYYLNKGKGSWLRKGWTEFDKGLSNIGYALSEVGQQSVSTLMQAGNIAKDFATGNIDNLQQRFEGNRASLSQMAELMNQDFTIGKMISTKETGISADVFGQDGSRTIKKYLLKAAEYGPEFVGNVIPDIMLYATGVGEVGTLGALSKGYLLKNSSVLQNATRALQNINLLKKGKGVVEGTKMAANAIDEMAEAPSWIKTGLKWLDKGLTNGVIDQTVDAQYSGYDTEAYSTPSMALSIGGTMIFETIPWLWKTGIFKMAGNLPSAISERSTRSLLEGTAWDPMVFFSNPENAEAIRRIAGTQFGTSPNGMTFDDFRKLNNSFQEMKSITKDYLNHLPEVQKQQINQWTKKNMYNILTQVFNLDANSQIGRQIRALVTKDGANVADLTKYLGNIYGDVEVGPWKSSIKLKNKDGTTTTKLGTYALGDEYDSQLDVVLDGGLVNKLRDGFTSKDINNISSIPGYKDMNEAFFTLGEDGKYYINEDGLRKLNIKTKDMPVSWAAREINKAEEGQVSNKFREVMKNLRESNRQLQDDTIDGIANSGVYQDIREKVADVVC